jgi:hypothetical protein
MKGSMIDYLLNLGVSDVCNGWPGAAPYAWTQLAHVAIGGGAVFAPLAVRLVALAGWIFKEVFSDFAGCEFSTWVALDSTMDMACAVIGFAVVSVALRNSQSTTWGKLS